MNLALEAKVGIFVIACFILIAGMSLKVGDLGFGSPEGYVVVAKMKNASGLSKDSPVVVSGVEVGKVTDIDLEDGNAVVKMMIDEKYKIPANVSLVVRSQGFLGEKYAELEIPADASGQLADGSVVNRTKDTTDFDQLGNKLGDIADDVKHITASLKDVLASEEGKSHMKQTVENVRVTTDALRKMIAMNEARVNAILKNVEQITYTLNSQTPLITKNLANATKNIDDILASRKQSIEGTIDNLESATGSVDDILTGKKQSIEEAIENIKVVTGSLKTSVDNINSITGKIDTGKGTIGKLVNDEQTVEHLNGALKGLNKTLTKLDDLQVYLEFEGERLMRHNTSKGRMNVKIVPNKKKYYLLGLASHPDGKTTETDTYYKETHTPASTGGDIEYNATERETEEGELLFTAQYAHGFRDDLFMRIGMMESEFGIGLDYKPFKNNKLNLALDAYDFPAKGEDRSATVDLRAKYLFTENFFVNTGFSDVANEDQRSYFLGFGVLFRDDDLKYLLGNATSLPIQ